MTASAKAPIDAQARSVTIAPRFNEPRGNVAAMSEQVRAITLTVNGETVHETVDVRQNLVDFLRERLALTGSHVGCEHGVCGACTVRLDGMIVRGCLVLAVQCAGSEVETIEGVSDRGEIADLQDAFISRNALQCGFCTPGMLLTAQDMLAHSNLLGGGVPGREAIREYLCGNYCRCTGYQAIVDAVEAVARARSRP
jgi:aerobic carbon-monoxide dehydrogenase small subunit